MSLTPVGGNTFSNNVTYTCSGLPSSMSCTFSPAQVAAGSAATNVNISIATAGPFTGTASAHRRNLASHKSLWLPISMPLIGILVIGLAGRRFPRQHAVVGITVVLVLAGGLIACGGSNNSSSSSSTVGVTVSPATVTSLYPSLTGAPAQTAQFTATVSGSSNTAVTWAVTGGNSNGTISNSGLYTAPASMPTGPVTVTATAQADSTKSASATVTLKAATASGAYPVTVTVTEGTTPSVTQTSTFNLIVQ
jgi:hypothetical protein